VYAMFRIGCLLVLLGALAQTGTAHAEKHYVSGFRQFDVYQSETRRAFGRVPACTARYVRVNDAWLQSQHDEPGVVADADATSCTIRYGAVWWRYANPRQRCVAMVHENGHLLGLQHSDASAWPVMTLSPGPRSACSSLRMHVRYTHFTWTYRPR